MDNYITVFDALGPGLHGWWFVVFGGMATAFCAALHIKREPMMPNRAKHTRLVISVTLLAATGLFFLFSTYKVASETHAAHAAIRANKVEQLTGAVSRYKAQFADGDFYERFCVLEKCFFYSDYMPTAGFHTTALNDGPIRPNLQVRVFYTGNVIIRLDIIPEVRRPAAPLPTSGAGTE